MAQGGRGQRLQRAILPLLIGSLTVFAVLLASAILHYSPALALAAAIVFIGVVTLLRNLPPPAPPVPPPPTPPPPPPEQMYG